MNILVISDLFPPYFVGGYEIDCRDMVEALSRRGHQVTILTSSYGLNQKLIQGNVHRLLDFDISINDVGYKQKLKYFTILHKRTLQLIRLFIASRNYSISKRIISQLQPDLVFLWHFDNITIGPAICAQDMGLTLVFRVSDYSLAQMKSISTEKYPFLKSLYRNVIFQKRDIIRLRAKNLLVVSQAVKDHYSHCGFSEATMKVIPSGVPSHFLCDATLLPTRISPDQSSFRLVFVGRVETIKGPDTAIEALAILKNLIPKTLVSLDIIGTGSPDYLEYLKLLTARFDVDDRVSFLGKLDSGEVFRRYQNYDILLFTSRWQEPFGRVIIEAMAQGLPVIATQVGGVPEIINDKENGLLVPSDNPESLANAIQLLLFSQGLAARISQNAFRTIVERFTIEKVAAQIEAYMANLIK
jgi:glycogen synthase